MPAELIDGKAIAAAIRAEVAVAVAALRARGVVPGLTVVLVGDDPASATYVGAKEKASREVGMAGTTIRLPASTAQGELLALVDRLNADPAVHGILVQMPLPAHLDPDVVIRRIDPAKDVDGFHPVNVGKLLIGHTDGFVSCTPAGVLELLRRSGVALRGAEAVVIGRSNIVGKPMALMLLAQNATVSICHSRTTDLKAMCLQADVIVAAVGRRHTVTADMVKPGAVVIDVGMNRDEAGKLCGDVDFEGVRQVAGYITPVPGGVGPMTIAMLLVNTLESAKRALNA